MQKINCCGIILFRYYKNKADNGEKEKTMAEITFEIVKNLGVLSETPAGWTKELNLVSWNGREPKYDIREWSPDHTKMGKGSTLTGEELKLLIQYAESENL